MEITAKWLTPAEVERTHKTGVATAKAMVQSAFPDWPDSRTDALLSATMTVWGRGPLITANTLVRTSDLITAAWDMRDQIAGVMLLRDGEGFTPLYLHRLTLALKMQSPKALWVDFEPLKGT
ncbi:hypothetical protein OIU14_05325 [Thalassobacter stenotrophicus]|uniref:hypothetical protein n=1 Tax=Thalassobacter stenotrophicus TaxID=266809 RepID=UPI0022A8ED52|nr:hypothetical protein [Thalassobacter stenotrophicus]UYP69153.1 hypothetical protein OIU14_05325 [Thalassobacter stenotrophicus]